MSRDAPHSPAAFINAIAEDGTKAEAIEWLQKTWDELCEARRLLDAAATAQTATARPPSPSHRLPVEPSLEIILRLQELEQRLAHLAERVSRLEGKPGVGWDYG